jgi:hypothetical protein
LTATVIDAAAACRIVDQLEGAGLVVWLDGGWGVDALLGRRSRHHRDLDLVIARHDCAVAREALAGLGFRTTWGCSPSGSAWLCHRRSRPRRATIGQIVRRVHPETASRWGRS